MPVSEKEIKDLLKRLSPEDQAFAEEYARTRIEVQVLQHSLARLQESYADLYHFLFDYIRRKHDGELRVVREEMTPPSFLSEYQLVIGHDKKTDEIYAKIYHITDEVKQDAGKDTGKDA